MLVFVFSSCEAIDILTLGLGLHTAGSCRCPTRASTDIQWRPQTAGPREVPPAQADSHRLARGVGEILVTKHPGWDHGRDIRGLVWYSGKIRSGGSLSGRKVRTPTDGVMCYIKDKATGYDARGGHNSPV